MVWHRVDHDLPAVRLDRTGVEVRFYRVITTLHAPDLLAGGDTARVLKRLHWGAFRREAGRMAATLTRILGVHNLDLAEDVVQDAFCRALEVWKFRGVPENPSAWLMATAKKFTRFSIRRTGFTIVVRSRSFAATSCSMGVEEKEIWL